jgi:hypothetical protein
LIIKISDAKLNISLIHHSYFILLWGKFHAGKRLAQGDRQLATGDKAM